MDVRSLETTFAAARIARRIPASWRLWLIGWLAIVAGAAHWSLLPLLALFATLAAWTGMEPLASGYLDPKVTGETAAPVPWSRRVANFAASLVAVSALGTGGVVALDAGLADSPHRLPEVVLSVGVVGALAAYLILSMGWKARYAIVATLWLIGTTCLAVWLAGTTHGESALGPFSVIGRTAARIVTVFLLAEALDWIGRRGLRRPFAGWRESSDKEMALLTPALAFALAAMAGLSPFNPSAAGARAVSPRMEPWGFLAATLVTALALGFVLRRGASRWARDRLWYERVRRRGWHAAGPMPAGLFQAVALAAAVAAAPFATWPAWLLTLALGVGASLIRLADRSGRGGARGTGVRG